MKLIHNALKTIPIVIFFIFAIALHSQDHSEQNNSEGPVVLLSLKFDGKVVPVEFPEKNTVGATLELLFPEIDWDNKQNKFINAGTNMGIDYYKNKYPSELVKDFDLGRSSVLFVILANPANLNLLNQIAKDSATEGPTLSLKILGGDPIQIYYPFEWRNMGSWCDSLAWKYGKPNSHNIMVLIYSGKIINTPDTLSFQIGKNDYLIAARDAGDPIHVLRISLDKSKAKEALEKLRQKQAPGLNFSDETEPLLALKFFEGDVSSRADGIFRKRFHKVNNEYITQMKILRELYEAEELGSQLRKYFGYSFQVLAKAHQLYKAFIRNTVEGLKQVIDEDLKELATTATLEVDKEKKVSIAIGEQKKEVPYVTTMKESTAFAGATGTIHLAEGASSFLWYFLQNPEKFNFEELQHKDLVALLVTANNYTFARLALLCQKELIKRIDSETFVSLMEKDKEFRNAIDGFPYLQQAFLLFHSRQAFDDGNFGEKLERLTAFYTGLKASNGNNKEESRQLVQSQLTEDEIRTRKIKILHKSDFVEIDFIELYAMPYYRAILSGKFRESIDPGKPFAIPKPLPRHYLTYLYQIASPNIVFSAMSEFISHTRTSEPPELKDIFDSSMYYGNTEIGAVVALSILERMKIFHKEKNKDKFFEFYCTCYVLLRAASLAPKK